MGDGCAWDDPWMDKLGRNHENMRAWPQQFTIFTGNLVGGLEHLLFFHILGLFIPPTDLIFSEGVKPPTRNSCVQAIFYHLEFDEVWSSWIYESETHLVQPQSRATPICSTQSLLWRKKWLTFHKTYDDITYATILWNVFITCYNICRMFSYYKYNIKKSCISHDQKASFFHSSISLGSDWLPSIGSILHDAPVDASGT